MIKPKSNTVINLIVVLLSTFVLFVRCGSQDVEVKLLTSNYKPITKDVKIFVNGKEMKIANNSDIMIIKDVDGNVPASIEIMTKDYYSYKFISSFASNRKIEFYSNIVSTDDNDLLNYNNYFDIDLKRIDFQTTNVSKSSQNIIHFTAHETINIVTNLSGNDAKEFVLTSDGNKKINSGQVLSIPIEFRPTAEGEKQASLSFGITVNNSLHQFSIPIVANAVAKEIEIQEPKIDMLIDNQSLYNGSSINFNSINTSTSDTKRFIIKNSGNALLRIEVAFQNSSDAFLLNNGNSIKTTVEPGKDYVINLEFNPNRTSDYNNLLLINTNVNSNKNISIQIIGKGVESTVALRGDISTVPSLIQTGRDESLNQALAICNNLIEDNAKDIRAYFYRGRIYYRRGNWNSAKSDFEKVTLNQSQFGKLSESELQKLVCDSFYYYALSCYQIFHYNQREDLKSTAVNALEDYLLNTCSYDKSGIQEKLSEIKKTK